MNIEHISDKKYPPMPNPSELDLRDPVFEAIWQTIKTWDVNVPLFYEGYCGANGSHVILILDAIRNVLLHRQGEGGLMDRTAALEKKVTEIEKEVRSIKAFYGI